MRALVTPPSLAATTASFGVELGELALECSPQRRVG